MAKGKYTSTLFSQLKGIQAPGSEVESVKDQDLKEEKPAEKSKQVEKKPAKPASPAKKASAKPKSNSKPKAKETPEPKDVQEKLTTEDTEAASGKDVVYVRTGCRVAKQLLTYLKIKSKMKRVSIKILLNDMIRDFFNAKDDVPVKVIIEKNEECYKKEPFTFDLEENLITAMEDYQTKRGISKSLLINYVIFAEMEADENNPLV